ncbi:MAG: hypothetical protein V1839_02595 [archaeon]
MNNYKNQLSIDYSKIELNNPQSFIKYAVEINDFIRKHAGSKSINRITYMSGKRKRQGKARICLDDFGEICISAPEDEFDNAKLANLLWALSRGGAIPSSIMFVCSNRSYDVSTTHAYIHAGKLQKQIKDSLEGRI